MFFWILTFLVLALVAALLGFGGVAGAFATIAKFLFFVFVAAIVIAVAVGVTRRRSSLP